MFLQWAETKRHKASEVESKRSILNAHLIPVLGSKPMDQLTPQDLLALDSRLKDHSPKTVNNVKAVASKALKVAQELGAIKTIPIAVKGTKGGSPEMRFYEPEDYARLVVAAQSIGPKS